MLPIQIARILGISTTTLRHYEEKGLVPPVARSASGYRQYTEVHLAYFRCVRAMMGGFTHTQIAPMMQALMAGNSDEAFWLATRAQADLYQEKLIAEKMVLALVQRSQPVVAARRPTLTIQEVRHETGVPVSTIRYWDKVGLIQTVRHPTNRYRLFTPDHIRQVLLIYALKYSVTATHHHYSIEQVKAELERGAAQAPEAIAAIVEDLHRHLTALNHRRLAAIAALHQLRQLIIDN